jgi:CheY-like chemotaxis protein
MDEATRARIFEPFFTTKEAGKGTGLGLATVYGIVKQSNGFIWVYSEPGVGTTFKIYLPLVHGAPELRTVTAEAAGPPHGTEVILLAEDEASVRRAIRRSLDRLGYTVIDAPSASVALALARDMDTHIDLLLTDVVMPDMSGRELARAFSELRPAVGVLYMSGYADDAVLRHGVLTSTVWYIQKPFTTDALARKLREVLASPAPRVTSGSERS